VEDIPMRIEKYRLLSSFLFGYLLALSGIALSAKAQTYAPYEWTWMGGSSTLPYLGSGEVLGGQPGVYGTLGTPSTGTIPGGRTSGVSWTDDSGNFWLFGGVGYDSAGILGSLNDLWKFNPASSDWTWMSGSSTVTCVTDGALTNCGVSGVYGTLGTPAAGNVPGGRFGEANWTDIHGNFWLFGGLYQSISSATDQFALNDLWEFNPSTREWAWMGGDSTAPNTKWPIPPGWPGVYGTLGTPDSASHPGSRLFATSWTDSSGNLWLFGGEGYDSVGTLGLLDDLWEFNPSTREWAWMGGSSTIPNTDWPLTQGGPIGVYGTLGTPDPANHPGGRYGGFGWVDGSGKLWLYGGLGWDANGNQGTLNDLWEYIPTTNEWAWIGGSSALTLEPPDGMSIRVVCQPPVYGILGIPAPGNTPGCGSIANWSDSNHNLWLFGGGGVGIWEFDLSQYEWTWMSGSSTSIDSWPGVYGTLGVPAAGDVPGQRYSPTGWTESNGNFWLFGGLGIDSSGHQGYLNDLWEYQAIETASTPTFSVAAGSYITIQTVAISDTTPGAQIYYTTDGLTTPTTSSTLYVGPITVSTTETIQAIAVAPGYNSSAVASATYTIPPDFSVSASPTSITVTAGQSGTTTIKVQDEGGFNSNVSFACSSGLPAGASCSFSPSTVTPPGTTSTTLTVTTTANSANLHRDSLPALPGSALVATLCCIGFRKRRRLQVLLLLAVCAVSFGLLTSCGGGGSASSVGGGGGGGGSQPVTSTVTLTATSGTALSHTTTFSITVN
jgi:N-acetylneuraminic acid mutarotase